MSRSITRTFRLLVLAAFGLALSASELLLAQTATIDDFSALSLEELSDL